MSTTTSSVHPSRVANIPQSSSKKRKKFKPAKPQPASTSLTRSQLRKKIRDITRLLSASGSSNSSGKNAPANHHPTKLSATARVEHERALAAYKHELSSQQLTDKRQALEKRYHKIRFFERRKATRALSKLKRQLAALDDDEEGNDERSTLEKKIHEAEVDLNYIIHYPGLEKYISLYKGGDSKDTNQKRERIRGSIEKRMEEGTLERGEALTAANAADGFGGAEDVKKAAKGKKLKGGKKVEEDIAGNDDDDEGSDGGFFEF
ncbi:hypothetical protein ABW19_dt0203900 [Dactylella cylindrospora]|nr:hypothetical protein ABW19_dt0203900 [Dactylella cylindrospora]